MSATGAPLDWDRLEALFEAALALPPGERNAFLERESPDPEWRSELESLLARADPAERLFDVLAASLDTLPSGLAPAEPHRPDPLLGQSVDHYRIEGRLGSGGMGVVYRARDTRLKREVALKFLPPHLGLDPEAKERFLVEAQAAAALEHPAICSVHEIGETEDGRLFIAMARYDGETLEERIARGPLPVPEAVDIATRIARGLAAAHAREIVHRDVKPGNVMLTTDGDVKLLDFGLAKVADVTATRPGITPGTVAYMSPERLRGETVDARSDLWSLGVVLYEMLTGVRPFRGGNDRALLQGILHQEPEPIAKWRPETPGPLTRTVERLLRKDPGARYRAAEELLADLARAPAPGAGGPRVSVVRRRWPALLAGIVTVLVALGGGAFWLAGRGADSAPAVIAPTAREPSIAVLPLANHSPDPADAVLADGMTEELIAMLARTGDLRVIARTSAFAFRDRQLDARRIADSLGVSNILEGSLQRIGSRLRVQVRLVDAGDGSTRWSETYDREFADVFSVQEEIARAVADALNVRVAGGENGRTLRRRVPDIAAYEFYLRGSDQTLLRSDSGVRQAVEHFRHAIAADSTYAAAYAGLARMYLVLSWGDDPGRPVRDLQVLAEQMARKAVSLDDSLAEAHATLGVVRGFAAYDFVSAETELKRAIALDPTRSLTRQWLAQLYIATGRPAEALEEARRALENDPLSPSAHAELAHALLANGRYDEALARLERIAAVRPPLRRVAPYAAQAYALKGMWSEAIAALAPQAENGDSPSLSLYGYMLARAGRRDEALRVRTTLLDRWRQGGASPFDMVVLHAGLGELDRAFAWLDRSVDDRSALRSSVGIMEPIFEDLREDPRFEPLRERLGLQKR